jgi:hypothetical protein
LKQQLTAEQCICKVTADGMKYIDAFGKTAAQQLQKNTKEV